MVGEAFQLILNSLKGELQMTASSDNRPPIRVGIIGPCPPPYGGITRVLENHLHFWPKDQVEAYMLPNYPPSNPQILEGAELHDLRNASDKSWWHPAEYLSCLWRAPITRPTEYRNFLSYNSALASFIKKKNINILYAHEVWPAGASAVLQSRISGIASVVVAYGEIWHTTPSHRRQHRIEPYVLQGANRVVSTSEHCRTGAIKRGAEPDKASVIYAGIDLDRFRPGLNGNLFRAKYDIPPGAVVISVLGLTLRRKLDSMLDALEVMSSGGDLHCLIGGVGDDFEYVKQRIYNISGVQVHQMGFVPEDELPEFYAATDVLVASPRTLLECMGQSMKEAMACGRTVVGANLGGVPEAIQEGINGLLFEPDNAADLVRALNAVCSNTEMRNKMGQNGRQIAEKNFNAEVSAKDTLEVITAAMNAI